MKRPRSKGQNFTLEFQDFADSISQDTELAQRVGDHIVGCIVRFVGTNIGRKAREILSFDEVAWIVLDAVRDAGDHWLTRALDRTKNAIDRLYAEPRVQRRYLERKFGRPQTTRRNGAEGFQPVLHEPSTLDRVVLRDEMGRHGTE